MAELPLLLRQINTPKDPANLTAWEYYIKSRKARDYRQKLLDSLYHPPVITVDDERTRKDSVLTLKHTFEGKELVREYIEHTMLGIEFLWGGKVVLETHEIDTSKLGSGQSFDLEQYDPDQPPPEFKWQKIRYTMHERKLQREVLDAAKDDRDDPYEFD